MEHDKRFEKLDELGDWKLEDKDQDIRGRPLVDKLGSPIGKISEMLVDLNEEEVAAIRLEDGRIAGTDKLEIEDDRVIYHAVAPRQRPQMRFHR